MPPDEQVIVRPNFDTFYSSIFFDLSNGPLILNIPDTGDQFYMMPLLDAFTNVIPGSPGTRTGETGKAQYVLYRKGIDTVPSGNYVPIECPTAIVWAIGRFQVDNPSPEDYRVNGGGHVISLQDRLMITDTDNNEVAFTPSNLWPDPTLIPNDIVLSMSMEDFFYHLNELLITNPPTPEDAPAMKAFAKIGVGPDAQQTFREMFHSQTELLNTMENNKNTALNAMIAGGPPSKDEWKVNLNKHMANFGIYYQFRAEVAVAGLGANLVEDAVYYAAHNDSNGHQLHSSNNYTITFDEEPPQNAFWSLTMYEPDGYPVSTASTCAVGHDSVKQIQKGDDGSITIYIQPDAVSSDPTDLINNNWLPSPASGEFNVMLRLYWPKEDIVFDKDNPWMPPPVIKTTTS